MNPTRSNLRSARVMRVCALLFLVNCINSPDASAKWFKFGHDNDGAQLASSQETQKIAGTTSGAGQTSTKHAVQYNPTSKAQFQAGTITKRARAVDEQEDENNFPDILEAPLNIVRPLRGTQEQLEKLREPIQNLREPITELKEPIGNLKEPIRRLENPIRLLDKSVDTLRAPINNLQNPINGLSNSTGNLKAPIENMGSGISSLKAPIHNLSQPIRELSQPINNLSRPVEQLNQPITNLSKPIYELNDPLSDVAGSLHGVQAEIGGLRSDLKEMRTAVDKTLINILCIGVLSTLTAFFGLIAVWTYVDAKMKLRSLDRHD